jgi:hypothetical protein
VTWAVSRKTAATIRLRFLQTIKYKSQERAWRDTEQIDQRLSLMTDMPRAAHDR